MELLPDPFFKFQLHYVKATGIMNVFFCVSSTICCQLVKPLTKMQQQLNLWYVPRAAALGEAATHLCTEWALFPIVCLKLQHLLW